MAGRCRDKLTILSANVRGLQTNIGDLTHSHVLPHNPDVIATVETFLNSSVPANYGQLQDYTTWHRRDRTHGTFGGVAVCFRKSLSVQVVEVDMPEHLELIFFKVWTHNNEAVLLCVCYRPQWQGSEPLHFIHTNLDALLYQQACKHLIIIGDLNQHLVARAFDDLLTDFGLTNHVDFPTHISGSSLDPVITDLPEGLVTCRPLGTPGSSDHVAILTTVKVRLDRDEPTTRTNWLWRRADWEALRAELSQTNWEDRLTGTLNEQVEAFTSHLLSLQSKYVPCQTYKSRPGDQPWFGFRCREAADLKSRAWRRLRASSTQANRESYKAACRNMANAQKAAIQRWKTDLTAKLSGQNVGKKEWWSSLKQQQGLATDSTIPPLTTPSGEVVTRGRDKAELFSAHFSTKMSVTHPNNTPPRIPVLTTAELDSLHITMEEVMALLSKTDTKKALGPDNISPHILRQCAAELATPLTQLYRECLTSQTWPALWKQARVVPVHKKGSRADPKNYRPISLLSVVGKTLEVLITRKVTAFLDAHHLLNSKQFGFRQGKSAADLLLLNSTEWSTAIDSGKEVFVVALDIAGAFDRVWFKGVAAKLRSLGVCGGLLHLLEDYLHGRTLHTVVDGHSSSQHHIKASVPQGSVLGPLLWCVYFNDILQLVPEAKAYADDCTLTFISDRNHRQNTVDRINAVLQVIASWSCRWQITLAPEKTQVLHISRRREDAHPPAFFLEGKRLPLQQSISILGVEVDAGLTFTTHVRRVARDAAWRLSCVRRVGKLLDGPGIASLYRAQVRPVMEYAPLTWSSCPPSYLAGLDRIQARAQRMVQMRNQDQQPNFQPLQQRRDVAGLCVMYKALRQQTPHLAPLRLPPPSIPTHDTRTAGLIDHHLTVTVPFARTESHLRSFLPRYSRMWNRLVQDTNIHHSTCLQAYKRGVNEWLKC